MPDFSIVRFISVSVLLSTIIKGQGITQKVWVSAVETFARDDPQVSNGSKMNASLSEIIDLVGSLPSNNSESKSISTDESSEDQKESPNVGKEVMSFLQHLHKRGLVLSQINDLLKQNPSKTNAISSTPPTIVDKLEGMDGVRRYIDNTLPAPEVKSYHEDSQEISGQSKQAADSSILSGDKPNTSQGKSSGEGYDTKKKLNSEQVAKEQARGVIQDVIETPVSSSTDIQGKSLNYVVKSPSNRNEFLKPTDNDDKQIDQSLSQESKISPRVESFGIDVQRESLQSAENASNSGEVFGEKVLGNTGTVNLEVYNQNVSNESGERQKGNFVEDYKHNIDTQKISNQLSSSEQVDSGTDTSQKYSPIQHSSEDNMVASSLVNKEQNDKVNDRRKIQNLMQNIEIKGLETSKDKSSSDSSSQDGKSKVSKLTESHGPETNNRRTKTGKKEEDPSSRLGSIQSYDSRVSNGDLNSNFQYRPQAYSVVEEATEDNKYLNNLNDRYHMSDAAPHVLSDGISNYPADPYTTKYGQTLLSGNPKLSFAKRKHAPTRTEYNFKSAYFPLAESEFSKARRNMIPKHVANDIFSRLAMFPETDGLLALPWNERDHLLYPTNHQSSAQSHLLSRSAAQMGYESKATDLLQDVVFAFEQLAKNELSHERCLKLPPSYRERLRFFVYKKNPYDVFSQPDLSHSVAPVQQKQYLSASDVARLKAEADVLKKLLEQLHSLSAGDRVNMKYVHGFLDSQLKRHEEDLMSSTRTLEKQASPAAHGYHSKNVPHADSSSYTEQARIAQMESYPSKQEQRIQSSSHPLRHPNYSDPVFLERVLQKEIYEHGLPDRADRPQYDSPKNKLHDVPAIKGSDIHARDANYTQNSPGAIVSPTKNMKEVPSNSRQEKPIQNGPQNVKMKEQGANNDIPSVAPKYYPHEDLKIEDLYVLRNGRYSPSLEALNVSSLIKDPQLEKWKKKRLREQRMRSYPRQDSLNVDSKVISDVSNMRRSEQGSIMERSGGAGSAAQEVDNSLPADAKQMIPEATYDMSFGAHGDKYVAPHEDVDLNFKVDRDPSTYSPSEAHNR